jgi:hypothetical protein
VTLVVYPWPDNVAAGDRDGFAPFFREPAEAALRKYFIAGDTHLTNSEIACFFDEVRSAVGDY